MNNTSENNLYVNIDILNDKADGKANIPCRFTQVRAEDILDNASDYKASIVRFSLPGSSMPIMSVKIQDGQSDPDLTVYSVTLSYDGNDSKIVLSYDGFQDNILPSYKKPSTASPTQIYGEYYWIYSYQSFLSMANAGLSDAYDALPTKPAGGEAPFIIFDQKASLFSLIAQVASYDETLASPVEVFFNIELQYMFTGLPVTFLNDFQFTSTGKDAQVKIQNQGDNLYSLVGASPVAYDYYIMTQEFQSVGYWSPYKRIVITTSNLPIRSELISINNDASAAILTDYTPDTLSVAEQGGSLEYLPTAQYRWADLISDGPIKRLDLNIYWEDTYQNLFPILIPVSQKANIKLLFARKFTV